MSISYGQYSKTFFYNLKKYGLKLSSAEIKGTVLTILITAFIISFRQWGEETFNLAVGLFNLFLAIVLVSLALFFQQLGQRLIAVYYGYDPEYFHSLLGLMIALVIAFATRGRFIVVMPGYFKIHHLPATRLGEFRYYTNMLEWSKVSFGGALLNFLAAVIFSVFSGNIIFDRAVTINLLFALYSMVPIPLNPGMYVFYYHKFFWAFCFFFVAGGAALLIFLGPIIGFIGAILTGTFAIFYYFFMSSHSPL